MTNMKTQGKVCPVPCFTLNVVKCKETLLLDEHVVVPAKVLGLWAELTDPQWNQKRPGLKEKLSLV